MRAISLWQPWASLWCSTRKVHETRHWSTRYRGPLAVHAAQRRVYQHEVDILLLDLARREFGEDWPVKLPHGAIIGVVELIDCRTTDDRRPVDHEDYLCGDWAGGRFAWQRGTFRLLEKPVPYKGRQGFFTVPDQVLR